MGAAVLLVGGPVGASDPPAPAPPVAPVPDDLPESGPMYARRTTTDRVGRIVADMADVAAYYASMSPPKLARSPYR